MQNALMSHLECADPQFLAMGSSEKLEKLDDGSVSDYGGSHLWQTVMSQAGTSSSPRSGCVSEDQSSSRSDDLNYIRMKLMCSYGGKILPRPYDSQLRYIGGETRIISVDRNISLPELLQKMRKLTGRAILLKYQLPGEDLDALITVKNEEDLENMMDEYDRLMQHDPSRRLRLFLFPDYRKMASAAESSNEGLSRNSEQQFVDALNGLAIPQLARKARHSPGDSTPRLNQEAAELWQGRDPLAIQASRMHPADTEREIRLPESLDIGDEAAILFGQPEFQLQQPGRMNRTSPRSMSPHHLPPARIPPHCGSEAQSSTTTVFQPPMEAANFLRQHYLIGMPQAAESQHQQQQQVQHGPRSSSRSPTRSSGLEDSPRTRAVLSPSRFRDAAVMVNMHLPLPDSTRSAYEARLAPPVNVPATAPLYRPPYLVLDHENMGGGNAEGSK